MGVVSAGAGSGKGFAILPDVGDQVLVLLIGGDPSQGVVLGGYTVCMVSTITEWRARRFGATH